MQPEITNIRERDCWFQRHEICSEWKPVLANARSTGSGLVLDNALCEFRSLAEKCCAVKPASINEGGEGGHSAETGVLLGLSSALNTAYSLSLPALPAGSSGYTIRVEKNRVIVASGSETGVLYGVYRFFQLLLSDAIRPDMPFETTSESASEFRLVHHWDNIDGTIERGYAGQSIFFCAGKIAYSKDIVRDYARLLASLGFNRLCLNNSNVRGDGKRLITKLFLPQLADLAAIFRAFGIRLLVSVNFASPVKVGGLTTCDPLDEGVAKFWAERAAEVYEYIPDFAGFMVKADSEGEPGPFAYNRTHAQGANMLARALAPYGGEVVWRCFVYNCEQDWRNRKTDRACAAYSNFMPLDGQFESNVILQIKHGPYDFQVREPVSPLFGALKKTRYLLELQITQEYTGQQIDLCFLPPMWEWVLDTDTGGETMRGLLQRGQAGGGGLIGVCGVANIGLDANWTGHTLAQSNLYGCGRLAWDPSLTAEEIAGEWSRLTFPEAKTAGSVEKMLLASYPAYEKYTAPFGVCFMVNPTHHYGPNPEGYEFDRWGTYHRANREAIGIDRGPSGTNYTGQYKTGEKYATLETCPENLLLFFHRVPYLYKMRNGKTLLQNIYDNHFAGCAEAEALLEVWKSLESRLSAGIYSSVLSRLERQVKNAREWRDVINTYFYRKTGVPDEQGRLIYE